MCPAVKGVGAAMSAILLEGGPVAERVLADVAARARALSERGVTPGLGTILVGDDPASAGYVRKKHEACAAFGLASSDARLGSDADTDQVLAAVANFNADPTVHAFIVQLPLPEAVDESRVLAAIEPGKDADGLHPANLGRLVMGAPGPLPCTPAGIQAILAHYEVPVTGRHVVIVGRGVTLGRPLALLLSLKRPHANAAVTVVHTGVPNWVEHTQRADIVIGAAGSPNLIQPHMVRPGAAVIGGGITWEGRRLVSDVDESVAEVAGWITPRLGGVGPTTVAMLLANTVAAAERAAGSSGSTAR